MIFITQQEKKQDMDNKTKTICAPQEVVDMWKSETGWGEIAKIHSETKLNRMTIKKGLDGLSIEEDNYNKIVNYFIEKRTKKLAERKRQIKQALKLTSKKDI